MLRFFVCLCDLPQLLHVSVILNKVVKQRKEGRRC